jgi:hypothetical protein
MSMGWFKGLSTEETSASGRINLNLIDGIIKVEANGLPKTEGFDLWLVDNGVYDTVLPEENDSMLRVGSLEFKGEVARLEANLGQDAFASFDPDLYIITRSGKSPVESRVLVGTTTLFHRL